MVFKSILGVLCTCLVVSFNVNSATLYTFSIDGFYGTSQDGPLDGSLHITGNFFGEEFDGGIRNCKSCDAPTITVHPDFRSDFPIRHYPSLGDEAFSFLFTNDGVITMNATDTTHWLRYSSIGYDNCPIYELEPPYRDRQTTCNAFLGYNTNSENGFYFNSNELMQLSIAAVPIPASLWLFGSGLLGLIGVAKRKKA